MKRLLLSAALIAAMAVPSLAEGECGPMPYAPAFPTVSDLMAKPVDGARKDLYAAFHQVKIYQMSLKSFRDCLLQQNRQDKQAIADAQSKPDEHTDATIDSAKKRMDVREKEYEQTLTAEQKMATDFNTLRTAHCERDTNPKVCPTAKK